MDLLKPADDFAGGARRAAVLDVLANHYDAPRILRMVESSAGQVRAWDASTFTDEFLAHASFIVGDTLLVFIGGTQTITHARRIVAGYSSPLTAGSRVVHDWFRREGVRIGLTPTILGAVGVSRAIVCGHSAGGSAAEYLADLFRIPPFEFPRIELVTYGAPRPAGIAYFPSYPSDVHTRWMNEGDPTPDFPPRLFDTFWTWTPLVYQLRQRLSAFTQTQGGRLLQLDGGVRNSFVSEALPGASPQDFVTWSVATARSESTAHSLDLYTSRLENLVPVSTSPVRERRRPSPPEEIELASHHDWEEELDDFSGFLTGGPGALPLRGVVLPPERRFKAHRQGKIWYVVFDETIIAFAPGKKRARALARHGNAFLRSLQIQGAVLGDAAVIALQGYIEAAAKPSEGFIPPMKAI